MQPSPSYPPVYPPPTASPPSPERYPARPRRSGSEVLLTFVGVLIGVLVFGGLLAVHAIYLIPFPCTTVGCPTPTPDQVSYANIVGPLAWISIIALDAAAGLSVALAFVLGGREEIPESTRRSVFLFSTVFAAAWIVGSFLLLTIIGSVRYYL